MSSDCLKYTRYANNLGKWPRAKRYDIKEAEQWRL